MTRPQEIRLDAYGHLVFKHKTNKRLFLERPYEWVDRLILLDETEGRDVVMDFKYSTFDFYAWTPVTPEEYNSVKLKYREIWNLG